MISHPSSLSLGTHCNYEVTKNDCAWNAYIKKGKSNDIFMRFTLSVATMCCSTEGLSFVEFGEFKSTSVRARQYWEATPPQPPASSHLPATTTGPLIAAASARAKAEEKRKEQNRIANHAIQLAKKSVNEAMDFIGQSYQHEVLPRTTWYLAAFKYYHLRAQQEAAQSAMVTKKFIWPRSFPDCTPALRKFIHRSRIFFFFNFISPRLSLLNNTRTHTKYR